MPVLAALARDGVAAESIEPVFAPAPYPAAHVARHRRARRPSTACSAEFRIDAQGVDAARIYEASDLRAAPLWELVTQQGGSVAALDWPATQGAPIADLAPDWSCRRAANWVDALASRGAGRAAEFARRAGGARSGNRGARALRATRRW